MPVVFLLFSSLVVVGVVWVVFWFFHHGFLGGLWSVCGLFGCVCSLVLGGGVVWVFSFLRVLGS